MPPTGKATGSQAFKLRRERRKEGTVAEKKVNLTEESPLRPPRLTIQCVSGEQSRRQANIGQEKRTGYRLGRLAAAVMLVP